MREIKVRAWVDDRFIYTGGENEWLELGQFGNWEWSCENNSGNGWAVENVQQYTGLKDINGTEIFEGDILFDEDGEYSKTCKIEWDEIGAKFFGIATEDGDSYEMQEIDGKIIGNIYENLELLS